VRGGCGCLFPRAFFLQFENKTTKMLWTDITSLLTVSLLSCTVLRFILTHNTLLVLVVFPSIL
jgi:hypothetical protein